MFASDWLLFQLDMTDRLQSSLESKRLWLESIQIAVHNFHVVHKRIPSQRAITDFLPTVTPDNPNTNQEELHEFFNNDMAYIPKLI
eukprot:9823250-Ditylum_brightwellii.AAC.1